MEKRTKKHPFSIFYPCFFLYSNRKSTHVIHYVDFCVFATLTWPSSRFPHLYMRGKRDSGNKLVTTGWWKVEINEKQSVSPLQLVDERFMKTMGNEQKQEDGDHVTVSSSCASLMLSTTPAADHTDTMFPVSTRIQTCESVVTGRIVYVCYGLSPGKIHAVSSVKRHVDRMFWKTQRMTEVCLIDTYTGSGLKNYPFSSMSPPNPIWNNTETYARTHTPASICQLYSHVCIQHKQSQAKKRAQRARAFKLDGKFSWSCEARSVPDTSSLTRITGNPHRKRFHTTGPQCFLQKNRE